MNYFIGLIYLACIGIDQSRGSNSKAYKIDQTWSAATCMYVMFTGKCSGHTSFITHIDWSTDSNYLRSNSGDYELLYWEVPACKQYTDVSYIKNIMFNLIWHLVAGEFESRTQTSATTFYPIILRFWIIGFTSRPSHVCHVYLSLVLCFQSQNGFIVGSKYVSIAVNLVH